MKALGICHSPRGVVDKALAFCSQKGRRREKNRLSSIDSRSGWWAISTGRGRPMEKALQTCDCGAAVYRLHWKLATSVHLMGAPPRIPGYYSAAGRARTAGWRRHKRRATGLGAAKRHRGTSRRRTHTLDGRQAAWLS